MNCRVVYCTMGHTQRCNSRIAGQCITQLPTPRDAIHVLQDDVLQRRSCIYSIARGRPVQYGTLQYAYCICGWRHGAIHYSAIRELHLWVKATVQYATLQFAYCTPDVQYANCMPQTSAIHYYAIHQLHFKCAIHCSAMHALHLTRAIHRFLVAGQCNTLLCNA